MQLEDRCLLCATEHGFGLEAPLADIANQTNQLTESATPRPWEFLSATSQIQQVPDTPGDSIFRAIQHADFNKDGRMDFVSTQARSSAGVSGSNYRSILYINENGKFVDRTSEYLPDFLTPDVRWWSSPHDYFKTGWIDLYVPGANGRPSHLFKNLGNDAQGNWLGFQDQSFRIRGPSRIATDSYHSHKADLNGDGWMDMVEYQNHPESGLGQIRVLINNHRVLVDETAARMPQRQEPSLFGHVEDLSGDGFPDISIVNLLPSGNIPEIRVLINDGQGNFPTSLEQIVPQPINSIGTYGLEHVDVNGDGKLDIYVINYGIAGNGARDAVLLNLGTGNNLFNTVYYPEFPNGMKDGDGDHPVFADFDGDGRQDIAVAQFASKTFVLRNESVGGVARLVENTPPQVPNGAAFRLRAFDANGDGTIDLVIGHNGVNVGTSMQISNVAEVEPNDAITEANPVGTFPALITGVISTTTDKDIFALPARAYTEGSRIRLKPASGVDLRLQVLDASGNVLSTSQSGGNGVQEQIDIPAGSLARFVKAELQGTLGSGIFRLEIDVLP
jgi:hypothetical protein